jgi:hypothetical protein
MVSRALSRALLSLSLVALASGLALGEARYGGVTPGQAQAAPPPARGAWSNLTWLGFLPEADGRTRLFAQLGREVHVEQAIVGGELWVMLERVRPGSRNATRPLDVRFFDTDLEEVSARRISRRPARGDRPAQPDGLKIIVRFRDDAQARQAVASMVREDDGYHYLYLDFDR